MGKANSNMFPIDGNLLTNAIKSYGITPAEASRELGYNEQFIMQCCRRGNINGAAIRLLEAMYGLAYDSYAPQEEPDTDEEEIVPEEEVVTEVVESIPAPIPLTKDDIYRAVVEANQVTIEIFLHKFAQMLQNGAPGERGEVYNAFQSAVFYGLQGVWNKQKDNIEAMLSNAIRSALRTNGR